MTEDAFMFMYRCTVQKMVEDRYGKVKCVRINTLNTSFVDKAHISHGISVLKLMQVFKAYISIWQWPLPFTQMQVEKKF